MSLLTALGISIGTLAGLLCILTTVLGGDGIPAFLQLAAWPGFVAWALYFAIGGKKEGLLKVMAANCAGAIMAVLIVLLMIPLSFLNDIPVPGLALCVAVFIGAFIMVIQSNWKVLSFVPGAFCGCACAFGFAVGTDIQKMIAVILSMWLGTGLAILSDKWGSMMAKK